MIERSDVISFFDRCAPDWDAEMIRNEPVIRTILDNADIRAGVDVLDVACGTGVLFPDYLARDVHSVTGVDIAPEMARRAAEKFPDARVTVLCGDIETVPLPQLFDRCMVYNAFPHFPDPARLIAHLATLLKPGGRLSVAHGMSRAMLDRHHAGVDVLDVACGTGVLFPDYLARDVHSVTGVDIAPEMARRAAEKFPDARVTVLCGDIETVPLPQLFDRCMVYNAFPHFPDPARLIAHLATLLKPGGRLSVAHGMSRAMLDRHHAGAASTVSVSLISETELAARMAPYFDVDVVISDDRMYQVCGTKK